MSKARELLEKIDLEIKGKVATVIEDNKEAIESFAKEKYQEAYDAKVREFTEGISKEYEKAIEYLNEVIASEEKEEVVEDNAPLVEEEISQPIGTSPLAVEPVVKEVL